MKDSKNKIYSRLLECRYLVLSCLLLISVGIQTINGHRGDDFWEHNAVVRELANNPSAPLHPLLDTRDSHAFYSPYSLGIAFISIVFGISSISTLTVASVFNLLLLLISLRIFVLKISMNKAASFYALLFIILLWGDAPWSYSGFFHVANLAYVMAYPSAFAASIMFLTFYLVLVEIEFHRPLIIIPIVILSTIILLTHQITFVVFCTGLLSIAISRSPLKIYEYSSYVIIIVISFIAAAFWPYYSFSALLVDSAVYHKSNLQMYSSVFERMYPLIIGIPLIIYRAKINWRDLMFVFFTLLIIIYVYGWINDNWTYGRVVSYVAIVLQIVIADYASLYESTLRYQKNNSIKLRYVYTLAILLLILPLCYQNVIAVISRTIHKSPHDYSKYSFLSDYIKQNETTLSDIQTSWYIPSFAGKVVAAKHPQAFVHDAVDRSTDVAKFFDSCSAGERLKIVHKYDVDYILLDKFKSSEWLNIKNQLSGTYKIVLENKEFILIRI